MIYTLLSDSLPCEETCISTRGTCVVIDNNTFVSCICKHNYFGKFCKQGLILISVHMRIYKCTLYMCGNV